MARFYGSVQGSRGQVTRLGGEDSGMRTICASWAGAVECRAYAKGDEDYILIRFRPWHNNGNDFEIYDGPIEGIPALVAPDPKTLVKVVG